MNKERIGKIVASVVCSLSVTTIVFAASTIGTNVSTTGNLSVNGGGTVDTDFEIGGTASISGAFTFGNGVATGAIDTSDWDISATGAMTGISGITTDGVYTQSGTSANTFTGLSTFSGGVSVSTNFEVTGNKRVGINAGAVTETTLEVGGTASISGAFTFGDSSATGAIDTSDWDISATGVMTGISGITTDGLSSFSGGVSVSTNFEVTGDKRVGINAGGSTDTTLEVGGIASVSGNTFFGMGSTATSTFTFESTSATQGACLKLKDSDGSGYTYLRVSDGAASFTTVACNP